MHLEAIPGNEHMRNILVNQKEGNELREKGGGKKREKARMIRKVQIRLITAHGPHSQHGSLRAVQHEITVAITRYDFPPN